MSTAAKHSPSPWRITATGFLVNEAGHIIAKMNNWPREGWARTARDEQAAADGKLIAHAPQLLHMCNGLRLVLDATSMYVPGAHPSIDAMIAASAKLLNDVQS